jgi:hypothetical protein
VFPFGGGKDCLHALLPLFPVLFLSLLILKELFFYFKATPAKGKSQASPLDFFIIKREYKDRKLFFYITTRRIKALEEVKNGTATK